MAVTLSMLGGAGWQFFTDDGVPLSGGKIFTYLAGTTTPQTTYTSSSGSTPNANPIILDAAGRTPEQIWVTEGVLYKYVIRDSNDTLIRTWDNIGALVDPSVSANDLASTTDNAKGDALVGFRQSNRNGFISGAVARTVNDKLQERVSVLDFGADPTGVSDSTNQIQAALDYFKFNTTETANGWGTLHFPKGRYLVNGTLTLGSARGLIITGDGPFVTTLYRTVDTGTMFAISTYGMVEIRDMYFLHETATPSSAWTNILFSINGAGGGNHLGLTNLRTEKFGTVVRYIGTGGNEDTNFFHKLRCFNFKTFLYVRNSQALINSIRDSTFFGDCQNVFDMSGFGQTHLDTCNIVVSGKVLDLYGGQTGLESLYTLTQCKFEHWPQGGPIGTTQLVVMNADMLAQIYFYGGSLAGGAPDPTIKQIVARGNNARIIFHGGNWGTVKIDNYRSVLSNLALTSYPSSYIKFLNCSGAPTPSNVTYIPSGSGVAYMGVIWEDCSGQPNLALTGSANGPTYNAAIPPSNAINRATFSNSVSGGTILNATMAFPHYGQPAALNRVQVIIYSTNGFALANGTIKMFSDAAKTAQIGATQIIPNGVVATPLIYNLTIPANTVVTEGVYVELLNTNSVFAYGRVYVETISI